MNVIVTIRREAKSPAEAHILNVGCHKTFCGTPVPGWILEMGIDNVSNPYVNKVPAATCHGCVGEFNNGRRAGFRDDPSDTVPGT